jgi:hypothetical protein
MVPMASHLVLQASMVALESAWLQGESLVAMGCQWFLWKVNV